MQQIIEVFGEIKRCAYSRAAILGFAVFIMMADLAFAQSVTINLVYGNKYKLEVTKNQNKSCVAGNKIFVVANVEYDFKYTAIPAADWLVIEPNPNPVTVTKTFAQADAGKEIKIGRVKFHHDKGKENDVVADVCVIILKMGLDEATFQGTGIHALKTDDGTYKCDGTANVRVPQIQVGATPKETQICYTWESSPEIAAKFSIVPNLATPVSAKIRIEGVQNGRSGTLVYEKDVSLSGASITKTFTTSDKLKKLVDNTTYNLTWKLSIDGGSTYFTIDTTANKLFAVAGSPKGGNTTLTRIGRVTDECIGLVNEPDIVQKLWQKVAGPATYILTAPYPNPEWKILDGTPAQCNAIASLFEKTIWMVGLTPGAGSVMYLYVDPAGGSHESPATRNYSTRDCRVGQNGHTGTVGNTHHLQNNFERLAFVDGRGGANNWEACYKYRHRAGDPWVWYAAGTRGASFNSVQNCMNAICSWTRWRYCNAAWISIASCITPGPYPERIW